MPPSAASTLPVTKLAEGEARKATAAAISVLFGLVSLLIALPGGVFWLFSKERQMLQSVPDELSIGEPPS